MKSIFMSPSLAVLGSLLMSVHLHAEPSLKDAFKNDFLVGAALDEAQFTGRNPKADALIQAQFNAISPENCLKWENVHPEPGKYDFGPGDEYVQFGLKHHMFIVGHNLIWHHQTPKWVFENKDGQPIGREALIQRMRRHIFTVVGHYKGKIDGWDVVNEALNENGTLRKSPWERIIGPDYLILAYKFAHEADPKVRLYYNDFSLVNAPKREGAIRLVKELQTAGIPIAAVGIQGHWNLTWPTPRQVDQTIKAFAKLGVKVNISEMDMNVLPSPTRSHAAEVSMNFALRAKLNPYTNGLPAAVEQREARRYASLFKVLVADHQYINHVTFWGVTDRDSWLNNWPVPGRTNYPLLFNRQCEPKPAFYAVIKVAEEPSAGK